MIQKNSLRYRLLGWISTPILLATIFTFLIGFAFAWHEIEEVYDAQMVHSAKVLVQLTRHELEKGDYTNLGSEDPDLHHKYERKMGFRVWVNGKLVTQSNTTKEFELFQAPPGFSDQTLNMKKWRFFVFLDPANSLQVEVSEQYDIRYELIGQLMSALIIPALILIPSIFLLVWIGVSKVINPIITLSNDVDKRGSDDLSDISQTDIPDEISPLILALNRLFYRLKDSLQREREFTDHAAHELRTPLAAMKTQTQVLLKKASGMPEYEESLKNLEESINRSSHIINQLLAASRLQHETMTHQAIDLSSCLKESISEIQPFFIQKNITLKKEIENNIYVEGNAPYISILIRNILDNAGKYTPAGGSIYVCLDKKGLLSVADTGPGVRDEDKTRIFERFVRVDKTGQDGSGLGLSIVQSIANAHGVSIAIKDNVPHGLIVGIQWNLAK
jgi:signal transduction histidine kinase